MTPEEYLDALLTMPGMWGPQVSRNGYWVAWTWFRTGPAADVYAAPVDKSHPPIRLTNTLNNTFLVSWAPDNRSVLVEEDKGGNERAQLFRVHLDNPLEMESLTMEDPEYFIRGGQLHPDGKTLIYGMNYDVSNNKEIEPTWMYRHDLESGERIPIARPEKGGYIYPLLSPDGLHVLYTRTDRSPSGRQIWLVHTDGTDDREIVNLGEDIKVHASWLPDSQRILLRAEAGTHHKVGVWSLEKETTQWLIDDPARNIEHIHAPFGSRRVIVEEVKDARVKTSLMNSFTGSETHFPEVPGNLRLLAPVGGRDWVAQHFSSKQPADLVRLSLDKFDPVDFTSLSCIWDRTNLTPGDLTQAEDYRWKSSDGMEIQGWLYRPRLQPRGTIVYVHGGPTYHSPDSLNSEIQFYVRQCFNVLDPNYRGSTGFNLTFQEAIKKNGWGIDEQEDIRSGIRSLIDAGIAEKGKVGMTGTSYGGYSAWCGITRYPVETLSAAAPVCGMTDLVVDFNSTRPDLRPYSEEMLGGNPEEAPETYYQRSPINFVKDIKGALLIVQGEQDPNVTPENVRAVRDALEEHGITYDLLTFPDEGHGISKPRNQKNLYAQLAAFFRKAFS